MKMNGNKNRIYGTPKKIIHQERIKAGEVKVWLADLTYTQQAISADVIPLGVGRIAEFAEARIDFSKSIRLFKYPEKLAEALDKEGVPDVIGFSNYIWNSSISLGFARRIKEISPNTITIFGGPNYPVDPKDRALFLRAHPEIDFYIIHESESAFENLMEKLLFCGLDKEEIKGELTSVNYIDTNKNIYTSEMEDRISDLSTIPSPYISGRLDEFFDGKLVPIVQTIRGCPFSCTFCVGGSKYFNKVYRNPPEFISAEINYIGNKMKETRMEGGRNDLFIADSNFGMYKEDIHTSEMIAKAKDKYSWPDYINVATGKNSKENVIESARIIGGSLRVSGSVQSLDPEVLNNINRKNISIESLIQMALKSKEIGANSYSEVILALPGDSKEKHIRSLKALIEADFNFVTTHQLMLLPGSSMCRDEIKEQYGMLIRYRVFPRCHGIYDVCGKQLLFSEIEEVCVGNTTLSFEEYLNCRKMHLIVQIFYNDGVFEALLKFLKLNRLSVFKWLELILESEAPGKFGELLNRFLKETREELWDSREKLEAFVRQPGIIERFNNGELGKNLLYTYKSLAITGYTDELAELALKTFIRLLSENDLDSPESLEFSKCTVRYHQCQFSNIFSEQDADISEMFSYDIKRFIEDKHMTPIHEYRQSEPVRYRFIFQESQRNIIKRYQNVFGNSPLGIGRLLTKVYVKKLFREAVLV